jgi:hypothetical protein
MTSICNENGRPLNLPNADQVAVIPASRRRILKSLSQISISIAMLSFVMGDSSFSIIDKTFALIEPDITGGFEGLVLIFLAAQGLHELYEECKGMCVNKDAYTTYTSRKTDIDR